MLFQCTSSLGSCSDALLLVYMWRIDNRVLLLPMVSDLGSSLSLYNEIDLTCIRWAGVFYAVAGFSNVGMSLLDSSVVGIIVLNWSLMTLIL
jgi:hypothetical protein